MKTYLLSLAVCLALVAALLIQPFAPVPVVLGALFSAGFAAIVAFVTLLCVGTLVSLLLPKPDGRIEKYVLLAVLGYASFCTIMVGHDLNGATGAIGDGVGDTLFFWALYRLR